MAGSQTKSLIDVRALSGQAEFEEAVQLQKTIWGFEDIDLLPVRLFVVASKVGGQAFGAYDRDRMVGFLVAIPGIKPGPSSYLHSHMMGVLAEYRNAGVGRILKLAQRTEAVSRGIPLIEWTFDPLEIKNAYFNIERLGAIVRRFIVNQYGTTSSPLHGSLPTDRCVAEWWISSARVASLLSGDPGLRAEAGARIAVPAQIATLRHSNPPQARDIQKRVSEQFLEYFDKGLAVIGFERSTEAGTYLLGKWESK